MLFGDNLLPGRHPRSKTRGFLYGREMPLLRIMPCEEERKVWKREAEASLPRMRKVLRERDAYGLRLEEARRGEIQEADSAHHQGCDCRNHQRMPRGLVQDSLRMEDEALQLLRGVPERPRPKGESLDR